MHQAREVGDGGWDPPRNKIVGDVENGEPVQETDVCRNLSGNPVSDEIEDPEEGQSGNARRNRTGDSLPVGDGEAGEALELTNGRRNVAGHVAGATSLLENGVLGLAPEVDVGDPASLRVAADSVPAAAAVGAGPGVEDAQVRLLQTASESQQCCPV